MSRKQESGVHVVPAHDRREFTRLDLPAVAVAWDEQGNELGRVFEIGGGGLLLQPVEPMARVRLKVGQRLNVTFEEPTTGNKTLLPVEVRYIRGNTVGMRFF
jgi:hypothetical protein